MSGYPPLEIRVPALGAARGYPVTADPFHQGHGHTIREARQHFLLEYMVFARFCELKSFNFSMDAAQSLSMNSGCWTLSVARDHMVFARSWELKAGNLCID